LSAFLDGEALNMNASLKLLLRVVMSVVGAYFLAWGVCLLVEAMKLHSLESLCGHNAPLQIVVYSIVIFLGWPGIAGAREAERESDVDRR
jgi:hypothetical protein